jgi:hypothetical protein
MPDFFGEAAAAAPTAVAERTWQIHLAAVAAAHKQKRKGIPR